MTKLVDESKRAYHAGTGFWRGEDRSPNARSIGIELVNFSLGQETYAPQQIDTLLNFLPPLIGKYNIRPEMIVGHSDIAPLRKADPGRAFPWERLANAGIGLWYQLSNAEKSPQTTLKSCCASSVMIPAHHRPCMLQPMPFAVALPRSL